MLTYQAAVERFMELKAPLGIPSDARLTQVEKRQIELSRGGEIDGQTGDSPPSDLDTDESERTPEYVELQVWTGEFTHRSRFWELAIDARSQLVRFRKSR